MNSKELYELIHQNSRTILPEFGAFLVKDSREKGFNPSNVSFSPFLRYNDGMLEVFVAKTKGISKEEAAKEVRGFVEGIKNELLEKGSFEIEGLGWLKRDQRGSLSFSLYKSDDNTIATGKKTAETNNIPEVETTSKNAEEQIDAWLTEEKTKVDTEEPKKKTRKISGPKAKVEKLTVTKTSKKVKELKEETITEAVAESANETTNTIAVESRPETKEVQATPIIETPKVKEEPIPNQVKEEIKPKINPIAKEKVEEIKNQQEVKEIKENVKEIKRSSLSRLIYTIIAVILVVILVLTIRSYYFPPSIESVDENITTVQKTEKIIDDNIITKEVPKDDIEKAYNEVTKENENKENIKQKEKENAQEEAIKNTLIQNSQAKNEHKNNSKTITSTGVKYYIIAGSFKKLEFAEKYKDELSNSGYKTSIVVQPSGMNAVSLGTYNTKDEANEAMKKMKSKFPNLWILKK